MAIDLCVYFRCFVELDHKLKCKLNFEIRERMKLQGPLEAYKRLLQLLLEWLSVYLSEGGDRRGGFRNLLLDGWWLEFWEIILLAAGDVERNPGPRRMSGTDGEYAIVMILFIVIFALCRCRACQS